MGESHVKMGPQAGPRVLNTSMREIKPRGLAETVETLMVCVLAYEAVVKAAI